MDKKKQSLLIFAAIALILVAAVFAYPALMDRGDIAPDNIVIMDEPQEPPYTPQIPRLEPPQEPIQEEPEEQPRMIAPDFTMLDAYGNEVQLSDFFGKPIVLNFWTTWCPSCIREMPYFSNLHQNYSDYIHILKVNLLDGNRETRETVDRFMYENGLDFPLFFDTTGEGSGTYGVRSIPVTFFICADGYPIARIHGAVNENSLQQGLDAIVN